MMEGRAWSADAFGKVRDVLALRERSWNAPQPGELLVRVLASGVGLPDLLMVGGGYPLVTKPPVTPGQEVCGTVVAAGQGSHFAVGDRVIGFTSFTTGSGGYADYAFMPEFACMHAPEILSDFAAAGFMIAYRTAYAALVERIGLKKGETLLVLGGAGSSGAAAIDLGRGLGARVIAVAGGKAKGDYCRLHGAAEVIDHRDGDVARRILDITDGKGVDAIFDPVGGELAGQALSAIARHGRIALIGYASGAWAPLNPVDMVLRSWSAVGVYAGAFTPEADAAAYAELLRMIGAKEISPRVSQVFALEDVPAMLESLGQGSLIGKVAVAIGSVFAD